VLRAVSGLNEDLRKYIIGKMLEVDYVLS